MYYAGATKACLVYGGILRDKEDSRRFAGVW